jgi:hypothetical protein
MSVQTCPYGSLPLGSCPHCDSFQTWCSHHPDASSLVFTMRAGSLHSLTLVSLLPACVLLCPARLLSGVAELVGRKGAWQRQEANPQNISNIAWGFASLGFLPPPTTMDQVNEWSKVPGYVKTLQARPVHRCHAAHGPRPTCMCACPWVSVTSG